MDSSETLVDERAIKEYSTSTKTELDIVDGGARAWCTLAGGWMVLVATFGYINAFGVYQDLYTRSNTASSSRISWIGSTQLFFLLATALPAGKLLDAGYFRTTTLIGSLLYVFSLFMLSVAHPDKYYQLFFSQGVGMGIGAGLLYVPAVAVQAHHWRVRRSLAMGIVVTGSSVGGIIFPILLNQLINGHAGFAWGVRASAFVVLGLLIPANLLMATNPTILAKEHRKPELKSILTDAPYIFGILGGLVVDWGIFFPYFYLQLFAILHGVSETPSFYTLAVMNAASIPGRVILNMLTGRFGVFNLLIASGIGCAALIVALFGISTVSSTMIFAILYGFASGAFQSLLSPAISSLARDESEMGIRIGFAFFVTSIGALTGTPINGVLLGETFLWYKALIWSSVTTLGGVCLLGVTRHLLARRNHSQLVKALTGFPHPEREGSVSPL